MVSDCTIVDCTTVQSVLKDLLGHLSREWQRLLHQQEEDELVLAKEFYRPLAKIEALLINAAIGKEISQGFGIVKRVWDSFHSGLCPPL